MDKERFWGMVKYHIATVAWGIFLWGIGMTELDYINAIYEQEREERRKSMQRITGRV